MKKFNEEFWTDLISLLIAFVAICVPTIAIFWFLLKIARGLFYLLDKLIDKI